MALPLTIPIQFKLILNPSNLKAKVVVDIARNMVLRFDVSAPTVDAPDTANGAKDGQDRTTNWRELLNMSGTFQFFRRVRQAAKSKWMPRLPNRQAEWLVVGIGVVERRGPRHFNPVVLHVHAALLWHHVRRHGQAVNVVRARTTTRLPVGIRFTREALVVKSGGGGRHH